MKKIILIASIFMLSCQKDKNSGEKHYQQYMTSIIKQDYDKAEKEIKEALKYDNSNSKYLQAQLNIYLKNCNKIDANKVIDKLLKDNPNDYSLLIMNFLIKRDNKNLLSEANSSLYKASSILYKKIYGEKKREVYLSNFIFVSKLMGKSNIELDSEAKKIKLSPEEQRIWNEFVNLNINDSAFPYGMESCK